jgi:hypothetical protein
LTIAPGRSISFVLALLIAVSCVRGGASITVVVYPNANHGFDSTAPLHFRPRPTILHNCQGEIDLDDGVFTE